MARSKSNKPEAEKLPKRALRVLSGTKPTGENLHLGNYFGALRQFVDLQEEHDTALYFIADYHAMTTVRDAAERRRNTSNVALDYLAAGLDPGRAILFRQSDLPEVCELTWILTTITPMGMLERAHAYKAAMDKGEDVDHGLFTYPVLMAADILLYGSHLVPVGRDQKQHIEMARDMAQRFNRIYRTEALVLPEPYILDDTATVPGTDGQKMSKSYGNTISMFAAKGRVKKAVMGIVTDSTPVEDPKDTDQALFELWTRDASTTSTRRAVSRSEGPHGDAGLTGRKIIVDTYGGVGRHGGGAFSGKDSTKVDRSGAYAARWAAHNVVKSGAARRCEIQLAYAIGVVQPVSVHVETFGTGSVADDRIEAAVSSLFDFSPDGIMEQLGLRAPIFGLTSAYGHFGREPRELERFGRSVSVFPWEKLDRVEELKSELGI